MSNIKDRIGSQNTIRVLSNASAITPKLINLVDVNDTLKTQDGMILVWDLQSQTFIMTSVIDKNISLLGNVEYENLTQSTLPTNGALVVKGGVGVGKNLNVGGSLKISGISTFSSVDILNDLVIYGNLKSIGITTTGGDLYVDENLYVEKSLLVSGISTFSSVDISDDLVIYRNLKSIGITTLASDGGITTTGGDLYVGGDLYIKDDLTFDEFTARNANVTGISSINTLIVSGLSTFTGISTFNDNVFVVGTLTAGLIDGGEY